MPHDARVTGRAGEATKVSAACEGEADPLRETTLSEGDPASASAVGWGSTCARVLSGVAERVEEEGAGDGPAADDPDGDRGRAGIDRSRARASDAADGA